MTLILINVIQDSEQHSRGFNHRSDPLHNANAGDTVIFKFYNLKSS